MPQTVCLWLLSSSSPDVVLQTPLRIAGSVSFKSALTFLDHVMSKQQQLSLFPTAPPCPQLCRTGHVLFFTICPAIFPTIFPSSFPIVVPSFAQSSPASVPDTLFSIPASSYSSQFLQESYQSVGFVPDNAIRAVGSLEIIAMVTIEDHSGKPSSIFLIFIRSVRSRRPQKPPALAPLPISHLPLSRTILPRLLHHVALVIVTLVTPDDLSMNHNSPPLQSAVLAGHSCLSQGVVRLSIPFRFLQVGEMGVARL